MLFNIARSPLMFLENMHSTLSFDIQITNTWLTKHSLLNSFELN